MSAITAMNAAEQLPEYYSKTIESVSRQRSTSWIATVWPSGEAGLLDPALHVLSKDAPSNLSVTTDR
jgi:hypothetical protein